MSVSKRIPRLLRSRLLPPCAALALGALLWVSFSPSTDDDQDYVRAMDLISALSNVCAELATNVALARSGHLANFDKLAADVAAADELMARLSALTRSSPTLWSQSIGQSTRALAGELAERAELVESLKSSFAVHRNSTLYLQELLYVALSADGQASHSHAELRALIMRMNQALQMQRFGEVAHWRAKLDAITADLRRLSRGSNRVLSESLDAHLNAVSIYSQRIDETYMAFQALGIEALLERLRTEHSTNRSRRVQRIELRMQVAKICVVAMASLLCFIVFRLSSQRARLALENQRNVRLTGALSTLAELDGRISETGFFDVCVRSVAEASGSDVAYIAVFDGSDFANLHTRAVWRDGSMVGNFSYPIKGAPCEDVLSRGSCVVGHDVARRYPDDPILTELGLESYFGVLLVDIHDRPLGLVALMYRRRVVSHDWLLSLLNVISNRVAIEIDRADTYSALAVQKEELQTTLNSIDDCVLRTDSAGKLVAMNPSGMRMLALEGRSVIGESVFDLLADDFGPGMAECTASIRHCLRDRRALSHDLREPLLVRQGTALYARVSAAPILTSELELQGAVAVIHDISDGARYRQELEHQANHDGLTGLLNRRAVERRLREVLESFASGDSYALMYIDLDRFKIVNDTCGHGAGDELLRQVATMFLTHVRDCDAVARLGGDEFVILLTSCSADRARVVSEKLLERLAAFRFSWEAKQFGLSASIGVVGIDSPDYSYTEVMSSADMACLQAKGEGRNRVAMMHPRDPAVSRQKGEALWVPRLEEALREGRFELFQQAIIASGGPSERRAADVQHVEILLRMRDAAGRLVFPNEFIVAAERYGTMVEIDRWVVDGVMRRMSGRAPGGNLETVRCVSINLSAQSLADEGLLGYIQDRIAEYEVDPVRMCFEVTETAAVANYSNAARLITELRALGCRIALDDFGSGHCSYGYIKSLPADFLKIDRYFTKNIAVERVDRAIVRSIVDVARDVGIESIAEGVEDERTKSVLEAFGICYMQGHYFGRPVPVDSGTGAGALACVDSERGYPSAGTRRAAR